MALPYLLAGFYLLICIFLILRMRYFTLTGLPWWLVLAGFLAKLGAGLFSWSVFHHIDFFAGTSDAFRYFQDGVMLRESLTEDPGSFFRLFLGYGADEAGCSSWISRMPGWNRVFDHGMWNDSRTMIRLNALMALLSGNHYQIHLILMNFLSFCGLTGIFHFLARDLEPVRKTWTWVMLLFIPSVLFWGSSVSKESLALFATGMMFYRMVRITERPDLWSFVLLGLTGTLMMLIKVHLLVILIPLSMAWLITENRERSRPLAVYGLVFGIFLLVFLLAVLLLPDFTPGEWLLARQRDFRNLSASRGQENRLFSFIFSNDLIPLLLRSPIALINTLVAPFFVSDWNVFTIAALAENLVLLGLMFWMLSGPQKPDGHEKNMLLFCLLFVLADFILIGWVTPSPGAVQRYRIISLPLLMAFLTRISARTGRSWFPTTLPS